MMKKVFALLPLLLTLPVAHGQNVEGQPIAAQYGAWRVPGLQPDTYSFVVSACTQVVGKESFQEFQTNAPIRIVDANPALSETVTPSAVTVTPQACSITIAPVNKHSSFYLTSATGGLQEALNAVTQNPAANTIVLTKQWYLQGGTTAMIGTVQGSTNVGLVDVTVSPYQAYAWNTTQSKYLPVSNGGGASAAGLGQAQYSGVEANLLASPQEFFNTSIPSNSTAADHTALVQADLDRIGCRIYNGVISSAAYHAPIGISGGVKLSNLFIPSGVVFEPPSEGLWYGDDVLQNSSPTNNIQTLTVVADGVGYTQPPTVIVNPSTDNYGTGGAATAYLSNLLTGFNVTPGSGYTVAPTVSISDPTGTGATAVATIVNGGVSLQLTASGSGYSASPTVHLTGGDGTGAAATATTTNGQAITATLTNAGTGYTSAPTVTIAGGNGTGAAAIVDWYRGNIQDVVLSAAGSGFTSDPTCTITGGGGTGATCVVAISHAGGVYGLTITNPGNYYFPAPQIAFSGTGTGAAAVGSIYTAAGGTAVLRPDYSYVTDCPEFGETNVPLGGSNVTIRGYKILGNDAGGQDIGIRAVGSHVKVENVDVEQTGGSGIVLGGQDNEVSEPFTENTLLYMRGAPVSQFNDYLGSVDLEGLDSRLIGGEVSTGSPFVSGGRSSTYPYDCAVHVNGGNAYVGGGTLAQVSDTDYCIEGDANRIEGERADFTADAGFLNIGNGSTFIGNVGLGNCTYITAYDGCYAYKDLSSGQNSYIGNMAAANGGFGASYYTASFYEIYENQWYGNQPAVYPAFDDYSGNNLAYASSYTLNESGGGGPGMHPAERPCNIPAGNAAPNLNACTTVQFNNTTPTILNATNFAPATDMKFFGSANDIIEAGGPSFTNVLNYQPCSSYPLPLSSNGIHFQVKGTTLVADCPPAITATNNVNGFGYTSTGTISQVHGDFSVVKVPTPAGPTLQPVSGTTGTGQTCYRTEYFYGEHSVVSSADACVTGTMTYIAGGATPSIVGQAQPGWSSGYIVRSSVPAGSGLTTGVICTNAFPVDAPCGETGQAASSATVPALGLNNTGLLSTSSYTPVSGACALTGDVADDDTYHYRCNASHVWTRLGANGQYATF